MNWNEPEWMSMTQNDVEGKGTNEKERNGKRQDGTDCHGIESIRMQ
jgi:hypothetical protein